MKKLAIILAAVMLLAGCGSPPVYETVNDTYEPAQPAQPMQLVFSTPVEAVAPTLQNEDGSTLYHCDGYTLTTQIFPGGDMEKTVKSVSGKSLDTVRFVETEKEYGPRLDFVWTAAGEEGLQLCRACILDDGSYHYALTVMANEEQTGRLQETWQDIFDTCRLIAADVNLSTGS